MKLQLILGSAGTGKSTFLYDSICREAYVHPEKNYIVIVPEQFTLSTQRELVSRQTGQAIMNIDVLSFLRLALRVFEELGMENLPVLDDMGKNMVLRRVLSGCKDSLQFFKGDIRKLGFLSELKSLLSEFGQYGIMDHDLEAMIEQAEERPMLKGKLKDARFVMEAYQEFRKDRFLTAEEILTRLAGCVCRSEMLKDTIICFDGFTGFTPVQLSVLREIFHYAAEARVTVTIDQREDLVRHWDEFELFSMSKKMIYQLRELAKETETEYQIVYPQEKGSVPYRFRKAEELAHLEKMLFRYPFQKYQKKQKRIFLSAADSREEEMVSVLTRIKQLLAQGYRYRDMAVLTGDIAGYAQTASYSFQKAGVPFFMDYKKNILGNPYVEFLRSFLAMFEKGFSYEAVFRHIGNGLLPFKKEEKDRMENYVLATGIRGYAAWKKVWERAYSPEAEKTLETLNELRERFVTLTAPAAEFLRKKKKTVLDYVKALYQYSTAVCVEEQLWEYEAFFKEHGEHNLEREYAQVYPKVMELLERMAELLGEEEVSLKEFIELFDAGIAEVKIGLIPPGLDQVIIGDLERTRLPDCKVLFFVGLNDGIVPKTGGKGGILSDLEREYLSDKNFELAPTQRELAYRGEYYLYLALTKPDSLLYLSYCRMNSECEPMRPSYLLHKIQMLYKEPLEPENGQEYVENSYDRKTEKGMVQNPEQEKDQDQKEGKECGIYFDSRMEIEQAVRSALGADGGIRYFAEGLRSYESWEGQPPLWKSLFYYYAEKEPEKLEHLLFCAFGNGTMKISEKTAKLLYGKELSGGVTRFEKFAACAYAHFLAYGMELKERQEFVLRSVDIGNIFHEALRIFGEKASAQENGWHSFTKEKEHERLLMSEESLMEALNNGKVPGAHALLSSSFRNRHLMERMKSMMEKTTEILTYQIQEGQMEPAGYELNFSKINPASRTLKLSDTEYMKLRGQIDRLDRTQEEPYCIRVVDYKTGKKEFSLSDVYYGLQMQLIVYLKAGLEASGIEKAEMAGGYYYRIDDPFVKEKNPAENEWKKLLKLQGISNSDPRIVQMQDKKLASDGEFHASVRSDVIGFATSSGGEMDARSSIAAKKEDLSLLMDYVQGTLTQMGKEILDGTIERNPYQKSASDTACMYCSFRDICSPKDPSQPGKFRQLSKHIPKEISSWKNKDENEEKLNAGEDSKQEGKQHG